MAIYGVVADIHGNLEALGAVLDALEKRRVDRIVCLGDIVGYNANSNECIEIVRTRSIESVAGNHDLIGIERLGLERCSNKAAYALSRTRKTLTPESRRFLGTLEPVRVHEHRFLAQHAGFDDVQQYIRTERQVRENAEAIRRAHPDVEICFFGHTHDPKLYEVDGERVKELLVQASLPTGVSSGPARTGEMRLREGRLHFINPGSVDASRKREHKMAEYAVFDSGTLGLEFHRVLYDDAATEAKASRGGYRIDRLTDWLYTTRRRTRSILRWPGFFRKTSARVHPGETDHVRRRAW